jgi:Curlin associated repeat
MKIIVILLMLTVSASAGNMVYIDQVGDNNHISIKQNDGDNKSIIMLNQGDSNEQNVAQRGLGTDQAFIGTPPVGMTQGQLLPDSTAQTNSNNLLSIVQMGTGNHTAAINLDSTASNNNNSASISQSGDANKSFTLQLSGSGIGATVVQDNPTVADRASMSIQCLTPPCTGYSYVKH